MTTQQEQIETFQEHLPTFLHGDDPAAIDAFTRMNDSGETKGYVFLAGSFAVTAGVDLNKLATTRLPGGSGFFGVLPGAEMDVPDRLINQIIAAAANHDYATMEALLYTADGIGILDRAKVLVGIAIHCRRIHREACPGAAR